MIARHDLFCIKLLMTGSWIDLKELNDQCFCKVARRVVSVIVALKDWILKTNGKIETAAKKSKNWAFNFRPAISDYLIDDRYRTR